MFKQLPNNHQSGFTLIELIMVIVVLGALAVTALPRYIDLETQAQQGAIEGIAGALAAGSAINFAACKAGATPCLTVAATTFVDCTDVADTVEGGISADYTITAGAGFASGVPFTCTILGAGVAVPASITTTFVALVP